MRISTEPIPPTRRDIRSGATSRLARVVLSAALTVIPPGLAAVGPEYAGTLHRDVVAPDI